MSEKLLKEPTELGAVITRSLEQVLHRLVRLIIGQVSLAKLQDLIRKVYLQEAERRLKADFPDKRVTLSKLAILTGLDTRTLNKVLNQPSYTKPAHEDNSFLSTMTPETQIIACWMSNPRFYDSASGNPKVLKISDSEESFANLVKTAITGRGHTYQALLNRMKVANSVEVDAENNQVKLISQTYYPFLTADESGMLDVGFSTASALLDTVAENIERGKTGAEKLFQRSTFTHTLSRENQAEFRNKLREFLSETDQKSRTVISSLEDKTHRPQQITAGVSLFYFETAED